MKKSHFRFFLEILKLRNCIAKYLSLKNIPDFKKDIKYLTFHKWDRAECPLPFQIQDG